MTDAVAFRNMNNSSTMVGQMESRTCVGIGLGCGNDLSLKSSKKELFIRQNAASSDCGLHDVKYVLDDAQVYSHTRGNNLENHSKGIWEMISLHIALQITSNV